MAPLELTVSALMQFDVAKPLLTAIQLSPLSVERNTSPGKSAPAKISPPTLMVNEKMKGFVSPVLTAVQLAPLSVERKTPPPWVPAKTWPLAFVADAMTSPPRGPFVCAQKLSPMTWTAPLSLCPCAAFRAGFVPSARASAFEKAPKPSPPVDGFAVANSARKTAASTTNKPIKTRRLKNADREVDFFFINRISAE